LIKMNLPIENKVITIFDELKKRDLIASHRKISVSKSTKNFKSSVFTNNTIIVNPDVSELDDNVIKFCLLHEEGHLIRKQYGIPALFLLIGLGLVPLLYCIYSKADFSILLTSVCFVLVIVFSSIRILTEPFHWDEYGSDEFASKILRDIYKIKKPSEIVKIALNTLPSSFDSSKLLSRLFLAFFEYHPSDEQRVKNIIDVIDEK
jgi:Zn-dependent protease with chaperone function